MIDAQFRFNQCNSFREEYISVFSPYGPVPTLYCLHAISLIETFSLIAIWWSRHSCLLCSSADIGNVPNNRENVSIREIAWRQYNVGRPASFFIRIVGILDLYELPPFTEVMNGHFNKIE
jgi:hypothetical protein